MEVVCGIIGMAIGILMCIMFISEDTLNFRTKAIENNCASYVVTDTLKGTLQFKWKNEIIKGEVE